MSFRSLHRHLRGEAYRGGTFSFTDVIIECCKFLGVRNPKAAHLE
jgi:hypothetical protein